MDPRMERTVLVRLAGIVDVDLRGCRGLFVVVRDRIDRNVSESVVAGRFIEVVDHSDRILDQRGILLDAGSAVNGQSRRLEFRPEDRAFAVLRDHLIGIRGYVEAAELLDPLLDAVHAVDRVVVLIREVVAVECLLEHQVADILLALLGRGERHVGGCRSFALLLAAEREAEERFLRIIDTRLHGVESDVEGRILLDLLQVVVAQDLVYGEMLRGERVHAVFLDREQQQRRVEDRVSPK